MSSEARFGVFIHPLMAFLAKGIPLDAAWHKNWVRTEIKTDMTAAGKKKERNTTPIYDKESIRWLEGLRETLSSLDERSGQKNSSMDLSNLQSVLLNHHERRASQMFLWTFRSLPNCAAPVESANQRQAD